MTPKAKSNVQLNPGSGIVSRLCHEPRTALAVLQQMLAPYIHSGRLKILYQYAPESADVSGDRVNSVTIRHLKTQDQIALHAPFFVDATELGDLLPLAGIEYVTGAESKSQTGEPHAVDGDPLPQDMQGFTYCFAVDYLEGRTTRSRSLPFTIFGGSINPISGRISC